MPTNHASESSARQAGALTHDVVVVGASAGGVEALGRLVRGFPPDLPAVVCVVLHVMPGGTSVLPDILARAGPLPARHASDRERWKPGRIYVGPPDVHLVLDGPELRLIPGPRHNGHRPAIDPLFESAARSFGPRVAGVVLSGVLDDGTRGLALVKRLGGLAVVQAPDDALYATMPLSAIQAVPPDLVLPARELGPALARLAHEHVESRGGDEGDMLVATPNEAATPADVGEEAPSPYTCPECGGSLWESGSGRLLSYNCRVGHSYSAQALLAAQGVDVEAALWSAVRVLEERASLAQRVAERTRERGQDDRAQRIQSRAADAQEHADTLRDVLRGLARQSLETLEAGE